MIFPQSVLLALLATSWSVQGHTVVRSIWVNGVDQGTGVGIRVPPNNGPVGPGYNSSPVKNLTSIDLRCNVLGDIQVPDTISVAPGDIVSFEWGHESRLDTDDIIADSHHGPGIVYISPDPPRSDSWIKLWEEGEYEAGKWFVTTKLIEDHGLHSIKIPADLEPGYYLLRPELITLHEADAIFPVNPIRGAQLYMACIQIKVIGEGNTTLPVGVGFPGAYDYQDPGIHYNVYWTATGAPPYSAPGPTIWSGAEPSVANPSLGTKKGSLTSSAWSEWINTTSSIVYQVKTVDGAETTLTSAYTATWPETYVTPTPSPSS